MWRACCRRSKRRYPHHRWTRKAARGRVTRDGAEAAGEKTRGQHYRALAEKQAGVAGTWRRRRWTFIPAAIVGGESRAVHTTIFEQLAADDADDTDDRAQSRRDGCFRRVASRARARSDVRRADATPARGLRDGAVPPEQVEYAASFHARSTRRWYTAAANVNQHAIVIVARGDHLVVLDIGAARRSARSRSSTWCRRRTRAARFQPKTNHQTRRATLASTPGPAGRPRGRASRTASTSCPPIHVEHISRHFSNSRWRTNGAASQVQKMSTSACFHSSSSAVARAAERGLNCERAREQDLEAAGPFQILLQFSKGRNPSGKISASVNDGRSFFREVTAFNDARSSRLSDDCRSAAARGRDPSTWPRRARGSARRRRRALLLHVANEKTSGGASGGCPGDFGEDLLAQVAQRGAALGGGDIFDGCRLHGVGTRRRGAECPRLFYEGKRKLELATARLARPRGVVVRRF